MKYYAVYLRETDELLASGNSLQCQKQMGLASVNAFYSMISRCLQGKNKKYEVMVEEVNDEL